MLHLQRYNFILSCIFNYFIQNDICISVLLNQIDASFLDKVKNVKKDIKFVKV